MLLVNPIFELPWFMLQVRVWVRVWVWVRVRVRRRRLARRREMFLICLQNPVHEWQCGCAIQAAVAQSKGDGQIQVWAVKCSGVAMATVSDVCEAQSLLTQAQGKTIPVFIGSFLFPIHHFLHTITVIKHAAVLRER